MVFYKIEAVMECPFDEEPKSLSRQEHRARAGRISEKTEKLFQESEQEAFIFTVSVQNEDLTFGCIANDYCHVVQLFDRYKKMLPFVIDEATVDVEEVTFSTLHSMLTCADRNDYVDDCDTILEAFGIDKLISRYSDMDFGEGLIRCGKSRESLTELANSLLFGGTMVPELERIYQKNAKKADGHPVHYLVQTDDLDVRKTVYKNLLSALYANGRVKNQRYSFVNYNEHCHFPGATLEALYRSSYGGALVIRYTNEDAEDGQFGGRIRDLIAAVCEVSYKYKNKVLTVLCLPRNASEIKDAFLSNWGSTAFVELHEDVVFNEQAVAYLKSKARENNVRVDKKLTGRIKEDTGYTSGELNTLFDEWHSLKLRNEIYPQYKTADTVKVKLKNEKPRGSAFGRLQSLVGLDNAKSVMSQALNYFKVQKIFADKGLHNERPSMHMVFTGNPGTAKTTVARLFAEVMKENGLLESGEIYEVGRADLVGKYVGHTAPLVKAAFKRARGGVLFIDEAYSLVDDRDGMFGDEAINTIVQEMENHRDDTIVIFAGYPDKMEGFLSKNPGLRSRIAFHIPFDDYNTDELCEIAAMIADEKGLHIAEDAKDKLCRVFDSAVKRSDFGNGRFARNVVEKARMAQANRLMSMEFDSITEQDVFTLAADDFEMQEDTVDEKIVKIGFCA